MRMFMIVCLSVLLVPGLVWGKVDFAKPMPVKVFKPLDTGNTGNTTGSNFKDKHTTNTGNIPPNVLPISLEIDVVKKGKTGHKSSICSAIRLTSTLVLTAAHCLEEFSQGQRIYAEPFTTIDKKWGLVLLNNKTRQYAKFNATVFFYRPGYASDGSAMSHAFDFGLIKLDSKLKANSSYFNTVIEKELEKALQTVPEELRTQVTEQIKHTVYTVVKKAFDEQQAVYKKFIASPLEHYDLLQMDPDVVTEEMKGRVVRAYFWPVDEKTGGRGPVKIFSGAVLGTDKANHKNTHTLLWNIRTEPGTSGSAVLDVERKLVVSVTSGPIHGEAVHGGGLISAEVCQWVKSQDVSVKCLAVEGGAIYAPTPKTATWGK